MGVLRSGGQHNTNRRARAWINDLPDAAYVSDPRRALRFEVPSAEFGTRRVERAVAVELMIPRGPRALYGLFGATFKPSRDGRLAAVVEVLPEHASPEPFGDAMGLRTDEHTKGLPVEYADAVADGVRAALASVPEVPAGVLRIGRAAAGSASSSVVVFRHLGLLVTELALRADLPNEATLHGLLERSP